MLRSLAGLLPIIPDEEWFLEFTTTPVPTFHCDTGNDLRAALYPLQKTPSSVVLVVKLL